MKRVSLKDVAGKGLVDKEKFIYNQNEGKPLKGHNGIGVKRDDVKKASTYIPMDLWIKYKTYELDQVKQGKSVSLNGLLVDLLNEKLKDY
jgi:hypothetical protein